MKNKDMDIREMVTLEGEMGKVKVSLAVFKTLVKAKTLHLKGVESVKVKAHLNKDNEQEKTSKVKVKILVVANKDICATDLGDEIRRASQAELEHFLGTKNFSLEVFIREISVAKPQNKPSVV